MVSPAPTSQAGLPRRGGEMNRSPPGDQVGLGVGVRGRGTAALRVVSFSKMAGFTAAVE